MAFDNVSEKSLFRTFCPSGRGVNPDFPETGDIADKGKGVDASLDRKLTVGLSGTLESLYNRAKQHFFSTKTVQLSSILIRG